MTNSRLNQTKACFCRDDGHRVGGSNRQGIHSCLVLVSRLATPYKRDAEQMIVQDLE